MQSLRDSGLSHGEVRAELLLVLRWHTDLRLSRFALQRQDGALQLAGQFAFGDARVTGLRLVRVTWEQNQSALVVLQTLHVLLVGFDGSVLSAMINTNTDGCWWLRCGGSRRSEEEERENDKRQLVHNQIRSKQKPAITKTALDLKLTFGFQTMHTGGLQLV